MIDKSDFLNLSKEAFAQMDEDGRVEYSAGDWPSVFGLRPEEVVGRLFVEMIHPLDHLAFWDAVKRKSSEISCRLIDEKKAKISLRLRKNGSDYLLVCRHEDQTSALSQQIVSQREKLVASSKLASLGEMTAGIAHEINNPLEIINLHTEKILALLEDKSFSTDEISKSSTKIKMTAGRIARIVRSLRRFSRNESGEPYKAVRFHEILEDTLEFCRERFKAHSIKMEVRNNIAQESIECRPTEISQVILNLLNNSYDAVENLKEKWIVVEVVDLNDRIKISVTDSGEGVPDKIVKQIMQPFFTTKQAGHGTGMGLSISKQIVENHGGSIRLDSGSKNTRFIVELIKVQPFITSKAG